MRRFTVVSMVVCALVAVFYAGRYSAGSAAVREDSAREFRVVSEMGIETTMPFKGRVLHLARSGSEQYACSKLQWAPAITDFSVKNAPRADMLVDLDGKPLAAFGTYRFY